MKFTINAKTFASALTQQLRVINAKNTITILDNFKLSLGVGGLVITASDLEITSTLTIEPTSIEVAGELCINASQLTDIVRKLGDKEMTFECQEGENTATITCGKGIYQLSVIKADEYPKRETPVDSLFRLPTEALIQGLTATRNAISTDTIRPTLCGVYMNILPKEEGGGIDFVATDTHQLVVCHVDADIEPQSVIIPAKTANIALNAFAKYPHVDIAITDRNIVFCTPETTLISVCIQGSYPNYRRVLPTTAPFSVKVNRNEMLKAISRVSGFANSATNLLILEDSGMMELKISAHDYENARNAEDSVMADGSMDRIKIGMSADYLTRVLNVFNEDEITLRVTDASRPIMINEGNVKAIVMPIQITE